MNQQEVDLILSCPGIMSPVEEKEIFCFYQNNKSLELRNRIALKNKGLISKTINKFFYTFKMEREEMEQEGFIGLIKAIDKFDPEMEVRFSTYAIYYIKAVITRQFSNCERKIRIPTHIYDEYNSLAIKYRKDNSGESFVEFAKKAGYSEQKLMKMQKCLEIDSNTLSLNAPIKSTVQSGKDIQYLEEIIPDKRENGNERVEREFDRELLVNYLYSVLPTKRADIICAYFGLGNTGEEMSCADLGKVYGVTHAAIRKQINKAMAVLQRDGVKARLQAFL